MAGYWFKVYTEILDDPKICSYSPEEVTGWVLLLAIAKKLQKTEIPDGKLPGIEGICFHSRRGKEFWEPVLQGLLTKTDPSDPESKPFLENTNEGLVIRKFNCRQAAIKDNERKMYSRKNTVTNMSRNVTESRERVEKEIEKEIEEDVDVDPNYNDIILVESFERASGLKRPTGKKEMDQWSKTLMDFYIGGIDESVMSLACKELTQKSGYVITSPMSIKKACEIILARESKKKQKSSAFDDAILR